MNFVVILATIFTHVMILLFIIKINKTCDKLDTPLRRWSIIDTIVALLFGAWSLIYMVFLYDFELNYTEYNNEI